jgi:hydrogenase maturation protease
VTTIICLGNSMRGDDAAGLAVAERLRARGVTALVEEPANVIEAWAGADDVVVVDTVQSGATPGTIHRIDAANEPLPAELSTGSTHLLGLADAIELARALDRLPRRLQVLGIEGCSVGYDDTLSAEVERAVDAVADALARG